VTMLERTDHAKKLNAYTQEKMVRIFQVGCTFPPLGPSLMVVAVSGNSSEGTQQGWILFATSRSHQNIVI
jgi:hypothetical protein